MTIPNIPFRLLALLFAGLLNDELGSAIELAREN
jgi:hypothetical protein